MKPKVLTGPAATQSIPPCNLHSCTKEDILRSFENAYSLDEWLYSSITEEEFFCKSPDRLRLPLIFYYAHTAVVFVNKFLLAGLIKERINPHFEALFETGVDEMSWDDTENYRMGGAFKWPPLEEVRLFRLEVREMVRRVIQDTPLQLPITKDSKWWAVFMGIEHEKIHLETSSVLIRQLPVVMVKKPEGWTYGPISSGHDVLENPMITAGDEDVVIGKHFDSSLWGWDNEYGCRNVRVPKFAASKFLITNGEFLAFVQSGGYEQQSYWSEEGWRWKTFREARHPTFWVCSNGCKTGGASTLSSHTHCNNKEEGFRLRLMFDVIPLPHDWPAEVNYLEAKAFCAWKGSGLRLPTEAEHHVMRGQLPDDPTLDTTEHGHIGKNNIDFHYGSSTPVGMYPPSTSGFCDVFGNVWEWVEDHFNGLPGSETHYLYDDFSAPCYDGQHSMMMGGSWISTGHEASRYARFSFRRHFFQHLGFRVAKTIDETDPSPVVFVKNDIYVSGFGEQKSDVDLLTATKLGLKPILTESTSRAICEDTEANLTNLIKGQYCSDLSVKNLLHRKFDGGRAIVIACGPGRIAFELAAAFDEVVGCDISGRCVDFAKKLSKEKSTSYPLQNNGSGIASHIRIELPEVCDSSKVVFKHLTWIPVELGKFDLIVFDGVHRLPNKKAWLAGVPILTKTSKSVVIIMNQDDEVKAIMDDVMRSATEKDCNVQCNGVTEIVITG